MFGPVQLNNLAWALTVMMEIVLCLYLARGGRFRTYPAFFVYITSTILQSALGLAAYRHWGFRDELTWEVVWGSQAFILLARWIAVVEIAKRVLASYAGIWVLAKGALSAVGLAVLGYGMSFAHGDWHGVVLSAERGLELSVAAVIVTLLFFVRYYRLEIPFTDRMLAIGFCLYACFAVVNYSIFEPRLQSHVHLWNFLRIVTYFASLVIWLRGVRHQEAVETAREVQHVSGELYGKLSSGIDSRLKHLNAHIEQIFQAERHRR